MPRNIEKENIKRKQGYTSYQSMIVRCYNIDNKAYKYYGGRGIIVCQEWRSEVRGQGFKKFIEDMGIRPSDKHSIDRIDSEGNYCKENCRWVLPEVQQNNKSNNSYLIYQGQKKSVSEWAKIVGISKEVIFARIRGKWAVEGIMEVPINHHKYTENRRSIII